MIPYFILFVLLLFNFLACKPDKRVVDSGVVINKIQVLDSGSTLSNLHANLTIDSKIWYKDSLAIEAITLTRFITDTSGKQTFETIIKHYVYMDPRTKSFYYYKNFSDTAKIIKKYAGIDSFERDGGWNFYSEKNIEFTGIPAVLSDTIIEHVNYKRVKFNTKKEKYNYTSIGFFRCDKMGTMFKLDKVYSDKIQCPLVKVYDFPKDGGRGMSKEINFISDTLTENELKVFNAWEKNAKHNPIKK